MLHACMVGLTSLHSKKKFCMYCREMALSWKALQLTLKKSCLKMQRIVVGLKKFVRSRHCLDLLVLKKKTSGDTQ